MTIVIPYTFVAGEKARANEVNTNFTTAYNQINANSVDIASNASDISSLDSTKANLNGSTTQRFSVANPIANNDAVNKQTLNNSLINVQDIISGLVITRYDNDSVLVSTGCAWDSTNSYILKLEQTKQLDNSTQAASATYYVYIIGNSDATLIDCILSTKSVTPLLPSGYTLYKQIGYYKTNSNNIISAVSSYSYNSLIKRYPNYSTSVSKSWNTSYVAEEDGYVYVHGGMGYASSGDVFININGLVLSVCHENAGESASAGLLLPVRAGDTYIAYGGNAWLQLRFFKLR